MLARSIRGVHRGWDFVESRRFSWFWIYLYLHVEGYPHLPSDLFHLCLILLDQAGTLYIPRSSRQFSPNPLRGKRGWKGTMAQRRQRYLSVPSNPRGLRKAPRFDSSVWHDTHSRGARPILPPELSRQFPPRPAASKQKPLPSAGGFS